MTTASLAASAAGTHHADEARGRATLLDVDLRAKHYGPRRILDAIRFSIAPGEVVSLVGPSGCGKSTLLRLVAGLDRDYDGRIALAGSTLRGVTREIGFVFQEPRLFPWLSAADNVAFDSGRKGRDDAHALGLLREVGLDGHADALPRSLSGGQAQRVAIARGLYTRPRLLLLDEPFSAVDAFTRMKLQDLLLGVARHHGIALLLVTHDLDEAIYLSDRVLVLDADPGRLRRELRVPLPHPRDRRDLALAALKAEALTELHAIHSF
ncbi:ABC transporter ATP-binding protein [Derxia gummosa]|uniref:ABC transporter ATP-binding protein n=1 Tax=Derxia gummosa DSM 723 TaxID=1121388 RepID=A0A8B6XB74_9BURK|nr:ABC transporter ATP-binding protein [Derxia gummosa]